MAKNQNNKADKQYKEDIIFFRISSLFIVVCAAIIGIFRLNTNAAKLTFFRTVRNPVYMIVMGVLLLLTGGYAAYVKKKKIDESMRSYSSLNFFSIVLYLVAVSVYWGWFNNPSLWVLVVATIVLALLYMVYHIYDRDFFLFTVANAVFLVTLWGFSIGSLVKTILSALLVVASALCCFGAYKLSAKYRAEKKRKLHFEPTYISFILMIALLVLEIVGGIRTAVDAAGFSSTIGEAVVYGVMFFQYLAGGIYYTIRLIKEA